MLADHGGADSHYFSCLFLKISEKKKSASLVGSFQPVFPTEINPIENFRK